MAVVLYDKLPSRPRQPQPRRVKRAVDWQALEREILSRLNLLEEFRDLGGRVAEANPGSDGWIGAYAVGRRDRNPSGAFNTRTGQFKDSADKGGGKACSFWE